jgi:hypothetical protein
VGLILLPKLGLCTAPNDIAMGSYLLMWGLFTGLMFIATLRLNRALQFVFASLTLLFFLLAIGDFTRNAAIKTFAGFEGIICGLSAIYTALAQVWNEIYGCDVAPLGKL